MKNLLLVLVIGVMFASCSPVSETSEVKVDSTAAVTTVVDTTAKAKVDTGKVVAVPTTATAAVK